MPGRPPNPTGLQILKGAHRKDPQRYRNRIAAEPQSPPIGPPPDAFMIFAPDLGYQRAEQLRGKWDQCIEMWPWLRFGDRDALQEYVELRVKRERREKLSGSDVGLYRSLLIELGGTAAGRARRGMLNAPAAPTRASAQPADPRGAFLARKTG